ncbi:MAG: hypothetical protein PHU85_11730, partial [Phycisphaerae bacterium]|nr:hypothetical protein [Phycisphaerae bacterium]
MLTSRTVRVLMATAAALTLFIRASFAETVGVWIQVEPAVATFTTAPNGNPDTIQAQCRNKTIKSNGARVLNDPINDGAQVTAQRDTHDGTDQQGNYHYTTATVEGRAGIGAVYEVTGVEVVVAQNGENTPGGGGVVVGGGPWWARARDKSLGTLYLADNILGYGCSEAYQYAPGDKEFYCGSTEKGWGDVRIFTDRAPAAGKTWFAVLYRAATQIGVYPLAKVEGVSRWQTLPLPGDLLYPVHYSVKLVQAENQDGVPAALGADPPPPAITFAITHADLDFDSDNDGVIRTGFDAEGKPIPLDNPARAWDDSCEAVGLAHVLPMPFDDAGKIADSPRTSASAMVRPRDVHRGIAALVNAGTCHTQPNGGTPLTPDYSPNRDVIMRQAGSGES